MRLRGKLVGSLSEADLQALVTNGVAESAIIEYKLELPGGSDDDKREFVADVSAFANAAGGCILYGVDTRDSAGKATGIPSALPGLPGANFDQVKQRLESILQDSVSPPLRAMIRFQEVSIQAASASVLVIGVPASFAAPHRVIFRKSNRFWRRSETGKYEPELSELKRMFLESTAWTDEAESFRRDRIELVRRRHIINANVASSVFVHVLPLGRLHTLLNLKEYEGKLRLALAPPANTGWDMRFGVDGYMTYVINQGQLDAYTQWFRFGGIEGYSAGYVAQYKQQGLDFPMFRAKSLTIMLGNYVPAAVKAMTEIFGHQPPIAIGVSMHGFGGAAIVIDEGTIGKPIDQNEVIPPMAVVEDTDAQSLRAALQPIVDTLWQSGGFAEEPAAR